MRDRHCAIFGMRLDSQGSVGDLSKIGGNCLGSLRLEGQEHGGGVTLEL